MARLPAHSWQMPRQKNKARKPRETKSETLLIVEDNRELLDWLSRVIADMGLTVFTAETASTARRLVREHKPDAALVGWMLPDGNGVELGVEFLTSMPEMHIVVMTGASRLPPEEEALCEEHNLPVLLKPFLISDFVRALRVLENRR
jgi:DNA-binding response OmpR family regulator